MREYAVLSGYTIDNLIDKVEANLSRASTKFRGYGRVGGIYQETRLGPTEITLYFVADVAPGASGSDAIDILYSNIKKEIISRTLNGSYCTLQIHDDWFAEVRYGDIPPPSDRSYNSVVYTVLFENPSGRYYSNTVATGTHVSGVFAGLLTHTIDTPVQFYWTGVSGVTYTFSGGSNGGSITIVGGAGTINVNTETGKVTLAGNDYRDNVRGVVPRVYAGDNPNIALTVSSGGVPTISYTYREARVF